MTARSSIRDTMHISCEHRGHRSGSASHVSGVATTWLTPHLPRLQRYAQHCGQVDEFPPLGRRYAAELVGRDVDDLDSPAGSLGLLGGVLVSLAAHLIGIMKAGSRPQYYRIRRMA